MTGSQARGLWLLLTALAFTAPCRAQEDVAAKLAEYMDAQAKARGFNGSVLVAKDGKTLLSQGYGYANLEHKVPNTPETKFRLGSVTKQFTAAAILLLQEQDKLDTSDPISKHLPDCPETWKPVTIKHLLSHTSGIPAYTSFPDNMRMEALPLKPEENVARFRDKPLEFEPGAKFKYSNSGYFLLGMIVAKASGKSYEGYLKDAIFAPLGMSNTGYDHPEVVLEHRASGYVRKLGLIGPLENAPYLSMAVPGGAGALYSTVEDMKRWLDALDNGKLLSDDSRKAMFTPGKGRYGHGWIIETRFDRPQIHHAGGIPGFMTEVARYPDEKLDVVVLCNVIPSRPTEVANDLAGIALGKDVKVPK